MLNRRQFLAITTLSPLFNLPVRGGQRLKLWLDTDIGSDIDDAVALAYLLRQPECHLLGISTVSGQPALRAQLAEALCHAAGSDIPVLPGIAEPRVIAQKQPNVPQAERLADGMLRAAPRPQPDAIDYLTRSIRQYPGEVTLLAVGPLTNIAALFERDPALPGLLKELVIMAGKYSDFPTPWGPTEWNAICDPEAAAMVFNADVPSLRAFGLDTTWQVSMTPDEVARRFRGDRLLEIVLDWSAVWFRDRELLHFHDPLAAAAIFRPDICRYKRGRIQVEMSDAATKGVTHFRSDPASNMKFADSVDARRFFDEYFSVFPASRH